MNLNDLVLIEKDKNILHEVDMNIKQKIESIFLTLEEELLDGLNTPIKKKTMYVHSKLDLEGNTVVNFIYFQPVSGKYHLIEYNIDFNVDDFNDFIKTKVDYTRCIVMEIELIIQEMVERPCETTCDKCKLKECSRGNLIGDYMDVKKWIEEFKK